MKESGMTWKEIMWQRSWINCQMLLLDAPKMIKGKKPEGKKISAREFRALRKNGKP